ERYPVTESVLWVAWDHARKEAGLWYGKNSPDNLRVHDLRHTAATRALGKCGNLKTVQTMLGHENIRTTARYAKTYIEDVRAAMPGDALSDAEGARDGFMASAQPPSQTMPPTDPSAADQASASPWPQKGAQLELGASDGSSINNIDLIQRPLPSNGLRDAR